MNVRVHVFARPFVYLAIIAPITSTSGCGDAKPAAKQVATRPKSPPKANAQSASTPPASDSTPRIVAAPFEPIPIVQPSEDPAGNNGDSLQPVFRPDDERPRHDDSKLAEMGIRRFDSLRLRLYTDIDPRTAATLPPLIDQAFEALVEYFGPVPPDRGRTEFQMTGYLIDDEALFREAGLIPLDLPPFEHGRHRRNEFWMREQKFDYYRRHLLIHEVTHCVMMTMPDVDAPVWYMEGMAERFGTHRLDADGTARFHVMPTSPEEFAGSGRITAIRNDYAAGKARAIQEILDLRPEEFLKTEHYAWSWALATFLDTHPRYHERFRQMGGYLQRNSFPTQFFRSFNPDARDLATEWTLFVQNLQYGYDPQRAAIDFRPGIALNDQQAKHECEIQADRGWQSSGLLMHKGESYQITATGQFELANQPKPWISEPQGISFRYFNGRPLGLLLGALRTETGETGGEADSMLRVEPIGRGGAFKAPETGTLYLRLNDEWNSLHNNRGQVTVTIHSINSPEPR